MKKIALMFIAIVSVFGISALSVAAQSFAPAVTSAALERQIYKKLLGLPRYGVFDHITYQVDGGKVVLGGKVITLGTRKAAESAVKRIPGVVSVVNNIDELPPSGFDRSIRIRALRAFADKGLYRYLWENRPDVRIVVDGGRMTLEGYVSNTGDRDLFNIVAHGVTGVFSVQNNLIVGRDLRR